MPVSLGIRDVRIEGRGERGAAACCTSGVRRAFCARSLAGLLSPPPRPVLFYFEVLAARGGFWETLKPRRDPAVLAHDLLGFVVPPVPGGSACLVWRGSSGASAALHGECWEEGVGVAGAGWAWRREAGGRRRPGSRRVQDGLPPHPTSLVQYKVKEKAVSIT